jgi:hypothetical protein
MTEQLSRRSLMLTGLTGAAGLAASGAASVASAAATAAATPAFDPENTVRALAALREGNCETYEAVTRRLSDLLREHCHVILVPWFHVRDATWWLKAYRDPDDRIRRYGQKWLDYQGWQTEFYLRQALTGEKNLHNWPERIDFFD